MNHETIFVFKPLSTGLGLEHGHQLRHVPGRWSLSSRPRRSRRTDSTRQLSLGVTVKKEESLIRAPLLFWQRCLALWCDVLVTAMLGVFVIIAAGLFAALFEAEAFYPSSWMGVIASLDWIRQSGQMVMSFVNLGIVLPWFPAVALLAIYLIYRLCVKLFTGISLGEWFARWLLDGVRAPIGRI